FLLLRWQIPPQDAADQNIANPKVPVVVGEEPGRSDAPLPSSMVWPSFVVWVGRATETSHGAVRVGAWVLLILFGLILGSAWPLIFLLLLMWSALWQPPSRETEDQAATNTPSTALAEESPPAWRLRLALVAVVFGTGLWILGLVLRVGIEAFGMQGLLIGM